jgi:hypothetical protein
MSARMTTAISGLSRTTELRCPHCGIRTRLGRRGNPRTACRLRDSRPHCIRRMAMIQTTNRQPPRSRRPSTLPVQMEGIAKSKMYQLSVSLLSGRLVFSSSQAVSCPRYARMQCRTGSPPQSVRRRQPSRQSGRLDTGGLRWSRGRRDHRRDDTCSRRNRLFKVTPRPTSD